MTQQNESTTQETRELNPSKRKSRRPTIPMVMIPHCRWIDLTMALGASPDISIDDLIVKAERIVTARTKYAQQVIKLEGDLLKKCPELDS